MLRLLAAASQCNTRENHEAGAEKEERGGLRYSRRRRHERAVRAAQASDDVRVVEEQGAVGGIRRSVVTAGAARCDRREGVLHWVDQVDVAVVRVGHDETVELTAADHAGAIRGHVLFSDVPEVLIDAPGRRPRRRPPARYNRAAVL